MQRCIYRAGNKKFRALALALRDARPDDPVYRVAWFNLVCLVAESIKPATHSKAKAERNQFKAIALGNLEV